MLQAILGVRTGLHSLSMEACHCQSKEGWEVPIGGCPPPRVGRPLTAAVGHCLCVVGFGLDLDRSPVVFAPVELS